MRKSTIKKNYFFSYVFLSFLFFLVVGCEQKNSLLPTFKDVSNFSLIDQSNLIFTEKNLKGKIWVADLIFTRCNETCPLQSSEMSKLQKEFLKEKLFSQFSVTIDPKFDTSNVLQKYGKRFNANFKKWFFLTGEKSEIHNLVKSGLGLSADIALYKKQKKMSSFFEFLNNASFLPNAYAHHPDHQKKISILHSFRFVLIDTELRVRGYYMSNNKEELRKLRRDINILLDLNK